MKKVKNVIANVSIYSLLAGAAMIIIAMLTTAYAYLTNLDSLFTTSPNFEPLSQAAPLLYNTSLITLCCGLAGIAIAGIGIWYLRTTAKKRR